MKKLWGENAVLIAGLAAIFTIIDSIAQPLSLNNYLIVTIKAFTIIALIGSIIWALIRPTPPEPFDRNGSFSGPMQSDPDPHPDKPNNEVHVWPRIKTSDDLVTKIKATKNVPLLVVGRSGVGKSRLLLNEVTPQLRQLKWDIKHIMVYKDLNSKLPKISTRTKNNTLLILDQFERFLDYMHDKDRKSLSSFLSKYLSEGFHLVVVVREDWYYRCVLLLEEWGINPSTRFDLRGLMSEEEKEHLFSLMSKATCNEDAAKKVFDQLDVRKGSYELGIVPVEAQIVGLVLENLKKEFNGQITSDDLDRLGGKDGIIEMYFKRYIDSSPFPATSTPVLFALAVNNLLHRSACSYNTSIFASFEN